MAAALVGAIAVASANEPPKPKKGDYTMWGGSTDRNMVSDEAGLPTTWDLETGKNVKWVAPLGSQSYGNKVISSGQVYMGTNNGLGLRPKAKGDKGVILCFDEKTGKFIWQATHDKLPTGQVNDWPEQGICSSPIVDGDRLYYVSNRCELVCASVNGLKPGKNEGPFTEEKYNEEGDADFVWILDMIDELGVFPHNLATSSPVIAGDLVFLHTSNGVDEGHLNLPAPQAPAFIAVNKKDGKVVWTRNDPGKHTLHGQWSSPAYGVIKGKPQVIFAGGDGWCYAFEPATGKPIWKYDLNPKDSKYVLGGKGTRNYIIATPVIYDDKVYLSVGQDPEHGEGPGQFHCIDATKEGDITQSGKVWSVGGDDFRRTIATCAIKDDLVYAVDLSGFLHCFDAKTGKLYWKHDCQAAVWANPFVADGKVYQGDEDGEVVVLQHGKEKKVLATNDMKGAVYTGAVAANGVLYINSRNRLYALQEGAQTDMKSAAKGAAEAH